jgi:hypothetical protein
MRGLYVPSKTLAQAVSSIPHAYGQHMMNRLGVTVSVLALAAAFAAPALGEMTIHLKDGRSITLPVEPQDIQSFTFGPDSGAPIARNTPPAMGAPSLPPAPLNRTSAGGVSPIPGLSSSGPSTAAALPSPAPSLAPSSAMAAPPSVGAIGTQPKPSSRVLHVGAQRDIRTIKEAAAAAKDGDRIEIDAGNYVGDVATWSANNLTIVGVGGRPHFDADGEAAGGKAIFVTAGNNIRIENVELSGATVGDGNGAGIRAEGANLTIVNCYFHDNQEGILTSDSPNSDIIIENSAFVHNGTQSGQTHGIYIGHIRTLFVRGSVFQETTIGHHIKSRADTDYILYNRILDFADGTASYSIDLSNGGRGYIIGNIIQKSAKADNYTFIAMAMEGPSLSQQELHVIGNTMVLDRSSGLFVHSRSPGMAVIADNIMSGPGQVLDGNGRLINNVIAGGSASNADANGGSGNRMVKDPGFVDPAKYDYHLRPNSPAIGAGVDMQSVNGFKLMPEYQNAYPLGVDPRPAKNPTDDGGYGFGAATSAAR